MTQRTQPPPAGVPARAKPAPTDSFALAAQRLEGQRPLRSARLQQIAGHIAGGRLDIAQMELKEHLARRPDDADAISLMARAQVRLGRRREADTLLARCLELAPDFDAARFNHAHLLFQLNKPDAALGQLDRLLQRDPGNPLYRQLKANILETTGENEKSVAICEQLAAENPDRAESWISYGHALRALGIQEKSAGAYRRAIECQPSSGLAWWSLANMKSVRFGETDIDAMLEQLKRSDIPSEDRLHLQFALGKAYEDAGAYERAFEQYAKANATMRLRIHYDPDTLTAGVAANKKLFTPEFLRSRSGTGCAAPDPIFVLGRPRSGSTLVEQILSSHSSIEGTAELPYITALAARLEGREGLAYATGYLKELAGLDASTLQALGEEYLSDTRAYRKLGRPFFIDKKPANFQHVGLIHLILPNAKIIDVRRHPAACSLSLIKHHSSAGHPRLAELGRLYRDYVELMAHFDCVLPGRVHRVIYEDMVADPESEVRRLLGYLGLPFEESCLRFYETRRTVLTPSSEQVRRPISGEAVDYWRNFEPWLRPLIASLGSVFTAYPSVPEELR